MIKIFAFSYNCKINNKMFVLLFCLISLSFSALPQDTSYVKINNDKEWSKNKHKKTSYSEIFFEIISYSKDSFKVQKVCFYEETKIRNTIPDFYKILNDSLILLNNQKINYFKESDSCYLIKLTAKHFKSVGHSKRLIPIIYYGKHKIYNTKGEAVLVEEYENNKLKNLEIINKEMNDSIYKIVDVPAMFPEELGVLDDYISGMISYSSWIQESAIQGTVFINAVVSSEGTIVNPEILRSVDPLYDREALKIVSKLPPFIPAMLNGEKVNSYIIIPVKFILK